LEPNPPPTSGAITRILVSGMSRIRVRKTRTKWGIWVAVQMVNSPWAGIGWTTTDRGSIALAIIRGWK
jgi:hypothetical protein